MTPVIGEVRRQVAVGRERAARLLGDLRSRWTWFDHLGRAYERYQGQGGDRLAAAVTYFSFLSFFPIVALAFAVVGYAVVISPNAHQYVTSALDQTLPGLADQLYVGSIAAAKRQAGIVGLLGLLYSGLGSISALREALRTMWLVDPDGGGNIFVKKLWDIGVLLVLGVTLLASVVVSSFATSATGVVLSFLALDGITGAGTMLRLVSIVVAVLFNTVIFLVLFSRLSGTRASWRSLLRGAMFGAVGFEVLKLAGTSLVGLTTSNPVYASFAIIVGLLVWIDFVSRFTLLAAAWTATRRVILNVDTDNPERVRY